MFVCRLEVEKWEWSVISPQRPWRCRKECQHYLPKNTLLTVPIMTMTTLIKVSNPGDLIIKDELEPVAKEVARLEAEGVDIIIGLGHR